MTDQNKPEKVQKTQKINGVRGMNDLLPADAAHWAHLDHVLRDLTRAYGYEFLRTPIVEATAVFQRGIGEVTDIVEKEMYSFEDRLNGEQLTLRPEGTAAVVRSVIENNLLYEGPKRLWYTGPMFRHERPQRGRYRQFHQFGIEALGFAGPDIDAEIILMGQRLWDELGLKGVRLEINSLGQANERAEHRAALIKYFEKHQSQLDEDSRRRLLTNPLRILDSKNPEMQTLIDGAPQLLDFLGEESLKHFNAVQALLKANNIPCKINPRLVRGLDYYNLTVFEWVTEELGAQGTIAGGGRYDPLIERMGGKAAPACGWAMGMERVLELMKVSGSLPEAQAQCDIFVLHQGGETLTAAMIIAERLRSAGIDTILFCPPDGQSASFKSQMKKADASGAAFAVIIGPDELAKNEAQLKDLRGTGEQKSVPLDEVLGAAIDALVGASE
ncbi:histidine--tRNA ligase [Polynucleobacter asymbioticus]|jgi:histidyl-tRNA synthetase|uniref:Histidine--tRNA ligase n=2 Tax=Polynucleobacter asymbioticus TaxID=576611 RepID=A4SYE0_POLAQ|nr:histidine--tRNA ligase [Polynucleobacter asymbioticus]ABP34504.1 histidyl-tRNA synthetase [Polynucleobacter asymbioticus QLW-P1DMWA-1]APB99181.1 histidine--tRNA ligase [Polynucleobacter asymbioticus]APC01481.1 histidine--tRNA ligase [Polynucleobacter asymbioticus]APC06344.1 histidine--tRNA ligase [Polynucleobacter asymbioticus]